MSSEERRVLARFQIEMPVSLQIFGTDAIIQATTRDVSASGVFFYTNFELVQGANIDFIMTLPPELTHTTCIKMACNGKITRVQNDPAVGRIGVAATIRRFDFLAAAGSCGSGGP